jgi:hypothetical protein
MILNMKGITKKVLASFGWEYQWYSRGNYQMLPTMLFTFIEKANSNEQKVLLVERKLNSTAPRNLLFIATAGWQVREKTESNLTWPGDKLIACGSDGPSLLAYLNNQN